jgi:lysophospholipase L1-like esterase
VIITDVNTGNFTYTPDLNQNGSDSFTFSATDGSSFSNSETVTVTINPVNDPPVATGDCATTPQAKTLTGNLSASDPDSDLLSYTFSDGSTMLTTPSGSVTINSTTGDFTYEPLSNGDRGKDSFTFQVSDTDGETSSATQTVIVAQTVMPLGDSITQGSLWTGTEFEPANIRVGYRKPLFDDLTASGYSFDFVGSLSHGWALLSDPEHEGHGGWTANEIAWGQTSPGVIGDGEGVFDWLEATPADVILLHAGTNGLDPNGDIDVEAILDEIDNWENSANGNPVTVILALIIDQDPINPDVTTFNQNVRDMAGRRRAAGDNIILVDQQRALTYPNDLSDALHPNDSGYAKMAGVWLEALTAVNPNTKEPVLDKCP